jgi:hypothetical protein
MKFSTSNFMKSCPVGVRLIQLDGWTDARFRLQSVFPNVAMSLVSDSSMGNSSSLYMRSVLFCSYGKSPFIVQPNPAHQSVACLTPRECKWSK